MPKNVQTALWVSVGSPFFDKGDEGIIFILILKFLNKFPEANQLIPQKIITKDDNRG